MLKKIIVVLCLCMAGLLATACSITGTRQLKNPQTTVGVMRDAFNENESSLFLHCLSKPVLDQYSEHIIRIGWSDIRPAIGEFVESAEVVKVEDYKAEKYDPLVSEDFVWPAEGARLKRVRLKVDGGTEDFLFTQEVDPPPANSKQARGFWIGDRYIVRTEHGSPQSYLEDNSPKSERTHWRLVFPYHPFQSHGLLTAKLQTKMANVEE